MLKAGLYEYKSSYEVAINVTSPYQLVTEFEINEISIHKHIRDGNNFSVSIDVSKLRSGFQLKDNTPYFILAFKDGVQIAEGYVASITRNKSLITIDCEDPMYLFNYEGLFIYGWKVFKGCQLFGILDYICANAIQSNLARTHLSIQATLGDFFTCDELLSIINFDMREESNVLAVLNKLTESVSGVYFKHGGIKQFETTDTSTPYQRIDVGTFDTHTRFVYNKANIQNLEVSEERFLRTRYINGYGDTYEQPAGTVFVSRVSTDIGFYPGALNPDYDVLTDYIEDDNINEFYYGAENLYTDISTGTKVNPTNAEKGLAAHGIYKKIIKRFKKANQAKRYTISLSSDVYPENLQPGNVITINYQESAPTYDEMTNSVQLVDIGNFAINGDFYVAGYDLTINLEGEQIDYELSETNEFVQNRIPQVTKKAIKEAKKNKEYIEVITETGTNVCGLYSFQIGQGLLPDTTVNGNPARNFTVNKITDANFGDLVTVPTNATTVLSNPLWCSDNPNVKLEFVTQPTTGVATFTIAVQLNDNWSVTDQINVKLLVRFNT